MFIWRGRSLWVVVMATALLTSGSLAWAAATSPFGTAIQGLPGINVYAQFDAADTDFVCGPGFGCYVNSVGGGGMNPSGGGYDNPSDGVVPDSSTSAPGAPLGGVTGDTNLSQQTRSASLPGGTANNLLYTSIGFRNQPGPQDETTAFYAGAWVKSEVTSRAGLEDFDNVNQVILGRRPFTGNGMGEGIDNVPVEDGWHLFMRNDDSDYGGSGKLSWQMNDAAGNLINFESTTDLWSDNLWHFVVFNYNGSPADANALSLYVDGSPVATTRTTAGDDSLLDITLGQNAWRFTVGNSPAKDNIWDGPIDEAFLGFGQLSAQDVADLWTIAPTPEPGSLLLLLGAGALLVWRRKCVSQ